MKLVHARRRARYSWCLTATVLCLACSEPAGGRDVASTTLTGTGLSSSDGGATDGGGTASSGESSASGSASASGGTSSDGSTGAGSDVTGSGTGSDTAPKFDAGSGGTGGTTGGACPGAGDVVEFSYIWIANSPQGTVSKIDTQTLTEVGRYRVSGSPSLDPKKGPSRTSVNLDGDVAVVDRDGGLVKIHARTDDCTETNGTPGIQTSSGPADVLAWGDEECVAWRTELPLRARPAAWTAPEELSPCELDDPRVWVAAPHATGAATVYLIAGADGSIDLEIPVPAADCNCDWYGMYGGAVDADNRFWTFPREGPGGHGTGKLYRFDAATASYESWAPPTEHRSYGIAVDRDGRIWLAGDKSSLTYFDPATETFHPVDPGLPSSTYVLRGLMQDGEGDLWIAALNGWNADAGPPGMLRVDAVNAVAVEFLDNNVLTGLIKPAGTSIDVDGLVWLVDTEGNQAFRYDPITTALDVVGGLDEPYTYSDMTGFGLMNVVPG